MAPSLPIMVFSLKLRPIPIHEKSRCYFFGILAELDGMEWSGLTGVWVAFVFLIVALSEPN